MGVLRVPCPRLCVGMQTPARGEPACPRKAVGMAPKPIVLGWMDHYMTGAMNHYLCVAARL